MHLSKRLLGSSPPTWGIRKGSQKFFDLFRFIPTYVGHTNRSSGGKSPHTVHPHLRGAYVSDGAAFTGCSGSSPPTWGIRYDPGRCRPRERFIPTYVGHTPSVSPGTLRPSVHPHLRGAYPTVTFSSPTGRGSSPPTWGIPAMAARIQQLERFIPTYVGHTTQFHPQTGSWSVHPHLRGAY